MPLSLKEDVKTVSELKQNIKAVFHQVHKTGRPVVITVKGKPDIVLLGADVYEEKLRTLNLALLLARGEEDIRRGKTRPAREFFKDLRRAKKVPR